MNVEVRFVRRSVFVIDTSPALDGFDISDVRRSVFVIDTSPALDGFNISYARTHLCHVATLPAAVALGTVRLSKKVRWPQPDLNLFVYC
jgi:hypothetical protein